MPSKIEMSEKINEALGTSVAFDRLPKSDLEELYSLFTDRKKLVVTLLRNARSATVEEILEIFRGRLKRGGVLIGLLDEVLLGRETKEEG